VLLADEVGKGKTYVALGVAFALLAHKRDARVVVLTHSGHMAKEWASRWTRQMMANCPRYGERFEEFGEWQPLRFTSFDALRTAYDEDVPPRIAIGSYETLKKYSNALEEASFLYVLLKWTNDCYGVYLSRSQRHGLVQEALGTFDFRRALLPARVSRVEAHRFLRECFDPDEKIWKVRSHRVRDLIDEFVADHHRQELAHQIDLLIIDEAHKLEGTGRQRVITRLLHKRFRKCIFSQQRLLPSPWSNSDAAWVNFNTPAHVRARLSTKLNSYLSASSRVRLGLATTTPRSVHWN
jgi:hypothetical protein